MGVQTCPRPYAFRRIVAAHHDDMRRVCLYVAGDRAIADQATQAAWVIAWKKIGSVREPARLRPWLMAVAVNEAKQLLRNGPSCGRDRRLLPVERAGR